MTIITRFAPSPTGYLHIGGARTALFNWLFAKHHGGKFMLRIEDTDRARSTDAAIDAILYGMKWLGLQWDDEPIFQFSRMERHAEVAYELVKQGKAYYCYCTPEELTAMREEAQKAGKGFRYDGRWRDRDPKEAPAGIKPAIRIKAPLTGEVITRDHVQGDVRVAGDQLDDMVILRSDGTPTYMLAVVVDDHDMGVTHIIRGDDHLTNAARQQVIYDAMGWSTPEFAHIPLIHGADGAKLSKRHGALGVEEYEKMGYLPEALRNYLLRLGWSHGDEEIISTEQAIQWFGLEAVGKSPSRFDFVKLENLNGHYMREADDVRLTELILPRLKDRTGYDLAEAGQEMLKTRIVKGMNGLKQRAKNLSELADSAVFYLFRPPYNEKAAKLLEGDAKSLISTVAAEITVLTDWTAATLEAFAKEYAERSGIKLGNLAQPMRAALTGSSISPSIFEVMEVLGKEESLARLGNI